MITLIVIFIVRDGEVDCADYQWLFKMSDQNGDGVVYMWTDYKIWQVDGVYENYATIIADEEWPSYLEQYDNWKQYLDPTNFDQFCDIMVGAKETTLSQ